MRRSTIYFTLIIIGSLFIVSVLRHMWSVYQSGKRLVQEQNAVLKLEAQNKAILQKLAIVQSDSYVEQEARDKLNFSKPGEMTVVIPQPQTTDQNDTSQARPANNWQRWWHLFFN